MKAIRSRVFTGHPDGETQIVLGTRDSWAGSVSTAVLDLHGSGSSAFAQHDVFQTRALMNGIAAFTTVLTADFGLQTWGNDTFALRAESARAHLEADWGLTEKLVLVAASMGFLNACNYARTHPERVAAIAGVVPGCDLTDLWANRGAGPGPGGIDEAFGGAYDPEVDGPVYNPVEFAASLDPDIPIHLWTAPDDLITVPSTADAFVAARPQTGRTILPTGGHSMASIANATPAVIAWVQEQIEAL